MTLGTKSLYSLSLRKVVVAGALLLEKIPKSAGQAVSEPFWEAAKCQLNKKWKLFSVFGGRVVRKRLASSYTKNTITRGIFVFSAIELQQKI
jgi:hypothetical protein